MTKKILSRLTIATFITMAGIDGAWSYNEKCVVACEATFNKELHSNAVAYAKKLFVDCEGFKLELANHLDVLCKCLDKCK